ncbi:MAGE-domain-containing protein [Artomyces pyxidatus]|uniref:MAGE-domain-containing protein n=1 Tax=Artomyces pyxidatus TaxID=48021 RepID=A0ACB8TAE1_9AGAM|nr:MAGE-domain-containing protein [Artomyces pyxidatus]
MARAGPSRKASQFQAQSQSQNDTQTQPRTQRGARSQKAAVVVDEEVDNDGVDEYGDGEDEGTHGEQDIAKKANDLVRLALFQEQRRMPLRRDEISKKVMGSQRGSFKVVFEMAQGILREVFGMELVELQTRAAAHESATGAEKEKAKSKKSSQQNGDANGEGDESRQTVTGMKKKAVAQGSKTYILRSTLHPIIIEHASLSDPEILAKEAEDPAGGVDFEGDEAGVRNYGSMIAWNSSDQLASVGVLYVILAVILVNGKVLSDMDLRTILRRLRLHPTTQLELSALATHRTLTVDAYLSQLLRQGYLDRIRLGGANRGTQPGKRGRGVQSQADDGDTTWEWRWGPRAASEVGEAGIARFVAEFMAERMGGDQASDSEDDEADPAQRLKARKKRAEEAQKRLAALMKGIERGAGGELADVI